MTLPAAARARRILQSVDLFESYPEEHLDRVLAAGQVRELGPGEYLFRAGDPADRIHVVLEGALEIARSTPDHPRPTPVAYLTPGEALGDMALLTESPRRSSARAPERAVIWTIERAPFEELTRSAPGFGLHLARVFARRLEAFINNLRGQPRRKELSGKLRYFDLPTVVQTLVSSNQSGILTILGEDGGVMAEVLLADGAVERARCGILEGEEAFYQLFLAGEGGEFTFRSVPDPDRDAVSRLTISLSAMNLLMEAMRLLDELPSVRGRLPDPDKPYQARTDNLRWQDEGTLRLAHDILAKLRTPRPVASLVGEVPCSTFTLYRLAAELHESGQIA